MENLSTNLNNSITNKIIQQVNININGIENSLNKINSIINQMKNIISKNANNDKCEIDKMQIQQEIDELSYKLNRIKCIDGFESSKLSLYDKHKTACLFYIAPGVDMSSVILNEKDTRLSGDLIELIDSYIYIQNGLEQGTDVTITLNTNGKATITGYIGECSTDTYIYPKCYNMTSRVNSKTGDVTFSGYGLSFTIPYKEYIDFLNSGIVKKVTIFIDNYYDRVSPNGKITTKGYVTYYGSGTKLTNFNIQNVDNLTSFYMYGVTGNYASGATTLHVRYTLADGTKVDDTISNYTNNIKNYTGPSGLRVTFNYWINYNSYTNEPYFIINLPNIYRLIKAGGIQTYKKTSKIIEVSS